MNRNHIPQVVSLVALFLLLLLCLSPSAQTGDGGEIIQGALRGGVLHPPGFPLQLWLNRLFVLLPWGVPAQRLSFLSALGLVGTAYFLWQSFVCLGCSLPAILVGTLAVVLFPQLWILGVQPEVFSLAYLFIAILQWQALAAAANPAFARTKRFAVSLGLSVGLAGAQHPITLVAAPAFLYSFFALLRGREGRVSRVAICVSAFGLSFVGLYLSLLLAQKTGGWPSWGQLSGISSVVHHALRRDYGTFNLAAEGAQVKFMAFPLLLQAIFRQWHFFLVFVALGFGVLFTAKDRRQQRGILLGSLLLGVALSVRAEAWGRPEVRLAVLERFFAVVILPLGLILGLGVQSAAKHLNESRVAIVSALFVLLLGGFSYADLSHVKTADLFLQGISQELSSETYYLSGSDLEGLGGVPTAQGVRFSMDVGLWANAWYRQRMDEIEPRLSASQRALTDAGALVKDLVASGAVAASVDVPLLEKAGATAELRGLVFRVQKNNAKSFTAETVRGAVRLCPLVKQLGELSEPKRGFEQNLYSYFARAFVGLEQYYRGENQLEGAAIAHAIFESLKEGKNPIIWQEGCDRLTALSASLAPGP